VRVGEDREVGALVGNRLGGDLVASIGILGRLQLGVAAPVVVSQDQDTGDFMTTGSLTSFGLGDVRLVPKAALLAGGAVDVALAVAVTLPTASSDDWMGDDGVTVAPEVIVGGTSGRVRAALDLGYLARTKQESLGLVVDDELFLHAGAGFRVAPRAELLASVGVATAVADPFGSYNTNSAEVHAGVGIDATPAVRVFAAGGAGLAAGFGTPVWRALAGLQLRVTGPRREVTPLADDDADGDGLAGTADQCPDEAETANSFEDDDGCPDDNPDDDRDGVEIPTDACPDQPETRNGYQDDDGCPDTLPDTDGDGLADGVDKCDDQGEDVDGFADDDGCPELDNDGDGVVDGADRCRDEAGPVGNGGCPDTDRDNDGVVDRLDNCPDEPGPERNFGCKAKQLVMMAGTQLKLLDVIYFANKKATIQKKSNKLLANVARVLVAHGELTKITVEGHTDDVGDDAFNKDLSQRRAEAVVAYLVKAGVPAEKLVAVGYGEDKPVASNKSKRGRAQNRRVELQLEGIAAEIIPLAASPAAATP
jgi:outer membrane protein OmpA-like peptidoglycan-associated protein